MDKSSGKCRKWFLMGHMSDTILADKSQEMIVLSIQLKEIYLSSIFFILMLISGFDLVLDYAEGTDFSHVAQEAVLLSLSLIALAWLLIDMRQQSIKIYNLRDELSAINNTQKTPDKYVVDAKTNLSTVISQQFNDWKLSNSEKDVGWLLLKGLSLKEIAALRETLEKTVRQQASAVYKKAGLNGRHAFSAWFIEEVL